MKYILLLFFAFRLFAQSDTPTKPTEDLTRNRLFMMSTGDLQPQGVVGIQIHELVGYQVLYSPADYIQLNIGYGIPRQVVLGGKIQILNNYGILKSVALNFDALLFVQNNKDNKDYFIPNIIGTIGGETAQISLSLTPLKMEKFKYEPRTKEPYDWWSESDGYVGDKMIYAVPAIAQTGLMLNSQSFRLKFVFELHYAYDGKKDHLILNATSFGIRKYWTWSYLDVALFYFPNSDRIANPITNVLPFISFGFFI